MSNSENWVSDDNPKAWRKQALKNKAERDAWEKGKKVKAINGDGVRLTVLKYS